MTFYPTSKNWRRRSPKNKNKSWIIFNTRISQYIRNRLTWDRVVFQVKSQSCSNAMINALMPWYQNNCFQRKMVLLTSCAIHNPCPNDSPQHQLSWIILFQLVTLMTRNNLWNVFKMFRPRYYYTATVYMCFAVAFFSCILHKFHMAVRFCSWVITLYHMGLCNSVRGFRWANKQGVGGLILSRIKEHFKMSFGASSVDHSLKYHSKLNSFHFKPEGS